MWRIERKSGMHLFCYLPRSVMFGDQLQIDSGHFSLTVFILDRQIRNRDFITHDAQAVARGNFGLRLGSQVRDLTNDRPLELVVQDDAQIAPSLGLNAGSFLLIEAVKIGVMICFSGGGEVGVGLLAWGPQPGPAQEPVSFAGQCQKFARASFRSLERALAHEPFADKTLAVLVELLPTAVIGVSREAFQGNDAEFPQFCDRLNLRFA